MTALMMAPIAAGRIVPPAIPAVFDTTGIEPRQYVFYQRRPLACGCLLGALYVATFDGEAAAAVTSTAHAGHELGFHPDYVWGLTQGWDCGSDLLSFSHLRTLAAGMGQAFCDGLDDVRAAYLLLRDMRELDF